MPQYQGDTDQTIAPAATLPPPPTLGPPPSSGLMVANEPAGRYGMDQFQPPPPSDRVLAPWQVEDRTSYYRAMQQMNAPDQTQAITQATGGNPGGSIPQFAQQQQDVQQFQQGLLSTPEGQQVATADPLFQFIGQVPDAGARQQLYGALPYIKDQIAKGQNPQDVFTEVLGNAKAAAGPVTKLGQGLQAVGNLSASGLRNVSLTGGIAGEQVGIPNVTLGDVAGKVPGGTTALNFAGQSLPYVAAGAIAPESLEPALFGGISAVQATPILDAYKNGQISGAEATKQLALTVGPVLAPIALTYGLDAAGALAQGAKAAGMQVGDFIQSPLGQRILTEERGSVGSGGEEPPKIPLTPEQEQQAISGQMENRLMGLGAEGSEATATSAAPNALEERLQRPPNTQGATTPQSWQEFANALSEAQVSPAQRQMLLKKSLGAVAARMEDVKNAALAAGKSPEEVMAAVSAARAGDRLPLFPGLAGFDKWGELRSGAVTANLAGDISNDELANLKGILNDMQDPPDGYKGPQPAQVKLLGKVYGPAVENALPMTPAKWSAYGELRAGLGALPTLESSFSGHGPFNQLYRMIPSHFGQWATATAGDLRRLVTSSDARAAEWGRIQEDPFFTGDGLPYGAGVNEGSVRLKQFGPSMRPENLPEEMQGFADNTYTGKLLNRIPGLARSKEAYMLTMDAARMGLYKSLAKPLLKLTENGEIVPPERFDALKQYVNEMTGWGNTGGAKPELVPGVPAMFSVHNWLSKLQWPAQILNKDPYVRGQAIKDVLAFAGFNAAILTTLKMTGAASVNLNPWGSFGDIQVGNTHINPIRDYAPITKLIAKVALPPGARPEVGGSKPSMGDWRQAIGTYLRDLESPAASIATDVATGQNFAGQSVDATPRGAATEAYNNMVPIFVKELVAAVKENKPFSYAALAPAFGGASVNTYPPFTGSKVGLLQALGLPPDATPAQIAQAEQKNPDAVQNYNQGVQSGGGNFAIYNKAASDALTSQQQSDTAFQSGSLSAQQWRDAYHTTQDNLAYLRKNLGVGTGSGNQPDVVKNYEAIFAKYPNADTDPTQKQAMYDALDQYQANLSLDDQKMLDQYIGFGAGTTPLVSEYRDTVKGLSKDGVFTAEQKVLQTAGLGKYQSIGQMTDVAVNAIMQHVSPQYQGPALRQLITNKIAAKFTKLTQAVNIYKLQLIKDDPQLLDEAVKFGLMQSKAALIASLAQ